MVLKYKNSNGNGHVSYRGITFVDLKTDIREVVTAEQGRFAYMLLEQALENEKFEEARDFVEDSGLSRTHLTAVVSDLIRRFRVSNPQKAKRLVEEFRDYHYTEEWLKDNG